MDEDPFSEFDHDLELEKNGPIVAQKALTRTDIEVFREFQEQGTARHTWEDLKNENAPTFGVGTGNTHRNRMLRTLNKRKGPKPIGLTPRGSSQFRVRRDRNDTYSSSRIRNYWTASSYKPTRRPISPVRDRTHISSPVKERRHISPVRDTRHISSPVRDRRRISSPVRERRHITSPIRERRHITSPVRERRHISSPVKVTPRSRHPISPVREKRHISPVRFTSRSRRESYTSTSNVNVPRSAIRDTSVCSSSSSSSNVSFEKANESTQISSTHIRRQRHDVILSIPPRNRNNSTWQTRINSQNSSLVSRQKLDNHIKKKDKNENRSSWDKYLETSSTFKLETTPFWLTKNSSEKTSNQLQTEPYWVKSSTTTNISQKVMSNGNSEPKITPRSLTSLARDISENRLSENRLSERLTTSSIGRDVSNNKLPSFTPITSRKVISNQVNKQDVYNSNEVSDNDNKVKPKATKATKATQLFTPQTNDVFTYKPSASDKPSVSVADRISKDVPDVPDVFCSTSRQDEIMNMAKSKITCSDKGYTLNALWKSGLAESIHAPVQIPIEKGKVNLPMKIEQQEKWKSGSFTSGLAASMHAPKNSKISSSCDGEREVIRFPSKPEMLIQEEVDKRIPSHVDLHGNIPKNMQISNRRRSPRIDNNNNEQWINAMTSRILPHASPANSNVDQPPKEKSKNHAIGVKDDVAGNTNPRKVEKMDIAGKKNEMIGKLDDNSTKGTGTNNEKYCIAHAFRIRVRIKEIERTYPLTIRVGDNLRTRAEDFCRVWKVPHRVEKLKDALIEVCKMHEIEIEKQKNN